jgi:hypothetical protein
MGGVCGGLSPFGILLLTPTLTLTLILLSLHVQMYDNTQFLSDWNAACSAGLFDDRVI